MAPAKDSRSAGKLGQWCGCKCLCVPVKIRLMAIFTMLAGPLFLIYLTLRCEKNQCVLFQLPLVIPTHSSVYWSPLAFILVLSFIGMMFLLNSASATGDGKATFGPSTGISSLVSTSFLLSALAFLKPDYIHIVYGEYLRMLIAATLISYILAAVLLSLAHFKVLGSKEIEADLCLPMKYFFGSCTETYLGHVELKYFFYVHVGLIAWALLDLLIVLNMVVDRSVVTVPVAFLLVSQYLYIGHTVFYENIMHKRPFVKTEGLGFFWLMSTLMYQPFFHSLPLYYAATIEISLPKPAILADCVFFLFGFVIYISSIHQREGFQADPPAYKKFKWINAQGTKRLLSSGYWGIVQKPDYLGYIIMWLSWTVACGFSGLSIVVLLVMLGTIYLWLQQSTKYKKDMYGHSWTRYTSFVPKQIIPLVF